MSHSKWSPNENGKEINTSQKSKILFKKQYKMTKTLNVNRESLEKSLNMKGWIRWCQQCAKSKRKNINKTEDRCTNFPNGRSETKILKNNNN